MKKIFLTVSLCIIASVTMYAQNSQNQLTRDFTSFSLLKSPNQQIIEQVVNSGVFIIKQSYELADSADNRYGLSGKKAFGTDYTLAVKVKNGFLVSERTLHPWDYNPHFDQYRSKYTPRLFPTSFSEVAETARYDSITIIEDSLKTLFFGLLYAQESENFFGDGFSVGGNVGDNEGWMVWFTKKKGTDFSKSTDLNLCIIKKRQTITLKKDNESYFYQVDYLSTSEEVVGGIFVIPEVISVGHMELKLCGVACRIENGWMLCCPFINVKNIFKRVESMTTSVNKEEKTESKTLELTPNQKEEVKTDKSKKKSKK